MRRIKAVAPLRESEAETVEKNEERPRIEVGRQDPDPSARAKKERDGSHDETFSELQKTAYELRSHFNMSRNTMHESHHHQTRAMPRVALSRFGNPLSAASE